jgi:CMP-N-acetylneuraminic acid synthetase
MKEKYEVTALVPMKDHSERIHLKNIRLLGKKPLFFYILESLESAIYVKKIIVNTDSPKIMSLAKENFPEIILINRPKYLQGDKVPMTPIIEHDLKYVKTKHFFQTHSTNPFLSSKTIDNAIKIYFDGLKKGFDSAMGVNIYQTRFYDDKKRPINHNPDVMIPSQNMPYLYEDNSNFYINSVENFYRNKNRVGKTPVFIEVPKLESIDIDEEEDFIIAEALYSFLKYKKMTG